MKPTTWFTPLDRSPFVQEHHDANGPPENLRVLEISSRSQQPLGRRLSAMFLKDADSGKPVESVYQASKCYGNEGGPAERVLDNGFDAKQLDRDRCKTGRLRGFEQKDMFWPANTGTQFYDRLWMRGAREADVGATDFDAYTDMFHRRGKALACQARTMAMMQGMIRADRLDTIDDPMRFSETMDEAFALEPTSPALRDELRVAVTGSQKFRDDDVIRRKLDEILERASGHPVRLMHGGAGDLDRIVETWASEAGVPTAIYTADWDQFPKNAGYRRNEEMLNADPHLVVGFPDYDGKQPRHLMHTAGKKHLQVEQVNIEGGKAWTDTPNGKLADLNAIGKSLARTRLHSRVEGPGILAAAQLRNGDPGRDGEIRVVIAPGPSDENPGLLRAQLDSIRERATPAAVRLAFETSVVVNDAINIAHEWGRNSGVHCDMYLRPQSGDTGPEFVQRIISEQQPHLVLGGRAMPRLYADTAERNRVPMETVTSTGWTRVSGAEQVDIGSEEARFRGRAAPTDGVVKPYPGRSAAKVEAKYGGHKLAASAPWAQTNAPPTGDHKVLNLRDEGVGQMVRDGAATRIDRKTKWGNPVPLRNRNDDTERQQVIEQYREQFAARIDSGQTDIAELATLEGNTVACHCAPSTCHGDVLLEAAGWAAELERERTKDQERPAVGDPRLDEALGVDEINVDEIPPWDDSIGVEPEEAVKQRAWEPGMSNVDALNRMRAYLKRNGATEEMMERYDQAVDRFEDSLLMTPHDDRADKMRAEHPDTPRIETVNAHIQKMGEAGASENQIERMRETVTHLKSKIDQEVRGKLADDEQPGRDVIYMLEKLNETGNPLEVGREIKAEMIEQGILKPRERPTRPTASEPLNDAAPGPTSIDENSREVRVIVCGSRSFSEPNLLRAKLDEVRERIGNAPMRVVTADGKSADRDALQWAKDAGVPCDVYEAAWDEENRAAGYKRNERMIEESGAHVVLAFPRDDNTPLCEHVIVRSSEVGLPIETIDDKGVTHTSTKQLTDLRALAKRTDERPLQVDDENLATIDPVEYAARYSAMSKLGTFEELETAQSVHGPADAPPAAGTGKDEPVATAATHTRD